MPREKTVKPVKPVKTVKRVKRVKRLKSAAKRPGRPPQLERANRPPREVTRDLFLVWRSPRLGAANPQRLTNPAWVWLARRNEVNAYMANRHFDGPSSMSVGPGWCNHRFGQTSTELPDGRVVAIGGEHEDYYDPDFFIYNDVIVSDPSSGSVEIYGYPREVFPPTDFHTATRVGDRILIVGCLGYVGQRAPGSTPVFALDTGTLQIGRVETFGDAPGWIHEHTAELRADGRALVVRGGERIVRHEEQTAYLDNIDDWSLDLESYHWTRLTARRWPTWDLERADGSRNQLYEIGSGAWHAGETSKFDRDQLSDLRRKLGRLPDFDLHKARYAPPFAHEVREVDEPHAYKITCIAIDGVVVRYVEEDRFVRVTVQGDLGAERVAALVEDARGKLEALERTPYVARAVVE